MRAACVKRVQPEPAASQFSKHSLLTNYALGPACGGLRRPAVDNMRSYVRNTKSADAIVSMALDKTNACQRGDCAESGSGTTLALSRQELEKMDLKLCRFKVRFSSPTLDMRGLRFQKRASSNTTSILPNQRYLIFNNLSYFALYFTFALNHS